jgi:predicted extracellular nuclease
MTPYLAAYDSVGGIITADTSGLLKVGRSQGGGTTVYYMQSTNQPWSGIWVVGPDSIMKVVLNGDSVVVKGTLTEFNGITEIFNVNSLRIVSRGNQLPAPLVFKTDRFGPTAANGNLNAEPYEGMLVRFDSVTVTSIDPVFQDLYQYEVSNSTAPILVTRDGRNTYSNVPTDTGAGVVILRVGDKIKSLTGIIHYFNNRYKVVPRSNADFSGVTGVKLVREDIIPESYALAQNYPNPFNPSTTIRYALPAEQFVTLKVYNVIGQEVATIINGVQTAGIYSAQFDASHLSTGMYIYRLTAGNFVQTKKMMLVK